MRWIELDSETGQFEFTLPVEKIVILQTILESYEELGVLRTIDRDKQLVCVITTKSQKARCLEMLKNGSRSTP